MTRSVAVTVEFTDYVGARSGWLRRIAFLLCQDWDHSDDLVQAAFTSLYVHWARIRGADHLDAYTRTILVRVYLGEQRSGWARKVTLAAWLPEEMSEVTDQDAAMDVRAALTVLPPRQRATIVLRYYCDLNIDQTATALGCSVGTVKSQTSKGLVALRQALEQPAAARTGRPPLAGAAPPARGPAPGSRPARRYPRRRRLPAQRGLVMNESDLRAELQRLASVEPSRRRSRLDLDEILRHGRQRIRRAAGALPVSVAAAALVVLSSYRDLPGGVRPSRRPRPTTGRAVHADLGGGRGAPTRRTAQYVIPADYPVPSRGTRFMVPGPGTQLALQATLVQGHVAF